MVTCMYIKCEILWSWPWALLVCVCTCFKCSDLLLLDPWIKADSSWSPCSLGFSATGQQYFSLGTNQPLVTRQQYFSLRTNQHQPSTTSQTNKLDDTLKGAYQPLIWAASIKWHDKVP
jgi:hypothetical protein